MTTPEVVEHYRALCARLEDSIRANPDNPDMLSDLALFYNDMDAHDAAIACLVRAIGLKHDHATAHLALGQILLARGDWRAGWEEYEWRNAIPAAVPLPTLTSAPWNGMSIPDGRLLLIGDQGYGDTIQFARYIPLALERVQDVILGCSVELQPLFRGMPRVELQNEWGNIPGHAVHARLSSLPRIFGTTPDNVPGRGAYISALDSWHALDCERLRVGLAWSGRPSHPNDKHRSLRLERLLPAVRGLDCQFVCLHNVIMDADLSVMEDLDIMDVSDFLEDFGDTAALIDTLDLVISVDTSVAHLAAAMGKPTWILLPKAADWRWMLERSDSPWYPSVKLFRQAFPGDWNPVIGELREALAAFVGATRVSEAA